MVRRVSIVSRLGLAISLLTGAFSLLAQAQPVMDVNTWSQRSLVSMGDTARLQRVMLKAQRGQPITFAVIGGSITQGAGASKPQLCYASLVADWWRQAFPQAKGNFVNAGIGATGSIYGALRAGRDLLSHHPDCVVVEYAVNDGRDRRSAETLEGLVRQILAQPQQPAVILLFMMVSDGGTDQAWHQKVGTHYDLPMVSYHDALWPELKAGRLKWSDISTRLDDPHPNDRGHALVAAFVTHLLDQVKQELPADAAPPPVKPLPRPMISDLFEHTGMLQARALKPLRADGWTFEPKKSAYVYDGSWVSDKPGSVIEFAMEGRLLCLMFYRIRGPMGMVSVQIDRRKPRTVDGWFSATWGGYRQTEVISGLLPPGMHHIVITLAAQRNPESTGHEFRILGLGAAGVE